MTFEEYLALVLPHATRPESDLHGVEHWRRVAENGERLAADTPGADPEVVAAFAAIHDSQRHSEFYDPGHGPRAADLASELDLGLAVEQMDVLVLAVHDHDRGFTTEDPTVGVCWDADRLDLPRVGIAPDPDLLSTEAAKARLTTLRS